MEINGSHFSCEMPSYVERQENPGTPEPQQPIDTEATTHRDPAQAVAGVMAAAVQIVTDITAAAATAQAGIVNATDIRYTHAVEDDSDDESSVHADSDRRAMGNVEEDDIENPEERAFESGDKRGCDDLDDEPASSGANKRRKTSEPPPVPHKSLFTGGTVFISGEIAVEAGESAGGTSDSLSNYGEEGIRSFASKSLLEKFDQEHEKDLINRPLSTLTSAEFKERMLLEWGYFENGKGNMSSYEMADDCRKWIQRLDVMHRTDLAFRLYVFSVNEGIWNLRNAPVEDRVEIQDEHNTVKAIFGSLTSALHMCKGVQDLTLFNEVRACLTDYRY